MSWRTIAAGAAIAVMAFAAAGCSSGEMVYEPAGGTYSGATVEELTVTIEQPSFYGADADEAEELRQEQLTALRSESESAAALADILTEDFPTTSTSVPFYAEEAIFDDREAWVVLEVWGSPGGTLDRQRLWVLERDSGEIVMSTVIN